MIGITRGFATLLGAAVAGFLLWVATQIGAETAGAYWATYGLIAAAGLTMALAQIAGGWTKWGWPRVSAGVFLLGFLPVLVVGGWVLLARQPADFFNTSNWSRDLGVSGLVGDLGELLAVIAFAIGLTFGLMFDTEGRRVVSVGGHDDVEEPPADDRLGHRRAEPVEEAPTAASTATDRRDRAADEPLTRERAEAEIEEPERPRRRRGLRRRFRSGHRGDY